MAFGRYLILIMALGSYLVLIMALGRYLILLMALGGYLTLIMALGRYPTLIMALGRYLAGTPRACLTGVPLAKISIIEAKTKLHWKVREHLRLAPFEKAGNEYRRYTYSPSTHILCPQIQGSGILKW